MIRLVLARTRARQLKIMKTTNNQIAVHVNVNPMVQFSASLDTDKQQDHSTDKGTATIEKEDDYIFDISNGLDQKTKEIIEDTLATHHYHRNAYFFESAINARGRRAKETSFFEDNPDYTLVNGKDRIKVTFYYRQTCKNVYYSLLITLNGNKKNIRLLKKLLKEK